MPDYEISTISDLEDAISEIREKSSAGTYYATLMNDIDGGWEEFPTISDYTANGRYIDFDLNGHEIKQFTLPSTGLIYLAAGDILRNGSIYNIYGEDLASPFLAGVNLSKMSISAKVKNCTGTPLSNVMFDRCATWLDIENFDPASTIIAGDPRYLITLRAPDILDPDTSKNCEESDFYIHIKNYNVTKGYIFKSLGGSTGLSTPRYCRLQGGIDSITPSTIEEYPYISDSDVGLIETVFNFSLPTYSGTISGTTDKLYGVGTTGVINTDLILSSNVDYTMQGIIAVDNTTMHNAEALTTAGFPVYDISPSS